MNDITNISINLLDFYKKEIKKGKLFILEKYLTSIPHDWFDCISFIFNNGMDQSKNDYVVIMDDKQTEELFNLLNKDKIGLFVVTDRKIDEKNIVWNCCLLKNEIEGSKDPEAVLIGGENLREFLDKNNIFYKSLLTLDGRLISVSDLKYLKKEGEDCRIPLNKDEIK